jgi:predicted porin
MKKSLIALAALATLSGAALAQSSVTIYGRLDASVGANKAGAPGVAKSVSQLESGLLSTSRLGLRGTEDLGGGMKAIFQLEGELKVDDGTAAGFSFNRMSIVGLQAGFGTIKLGRHDTSFDDIRDISVSSNLWDSEFSPTKIAYVNSVGGVAVAHVADYSSRASNQIRYESPSFGGFTAGVSYGFDEQAAPVKRDVTAFNLRYRAGGLDAGIGYQEQDNEVAASKREYTTIAGAYNFGMFRVSGGYNKAEQGTLESTGYTIGANMPVDAWDFSVGYATNKSELAGVTSAKSSGFSAGATYSLSKRTRVYAAFLNGKAENAAGTKIADRKLYAVGVRHDF